MWVRFCQNSWQRLRSTSDLSSVLQNQRLILILSYFCSVLRFWLRSSVSAVTVVSEEMFLMSHMSTEKLILSEKKTVTHKLITERLRVLFLSKKLVSLLQLPQNKLLHRIEKCMHSQKEHCVSKIQTAEICLCLYSSCISLSCNVN